MLNTNPGLNLKLKPHIFRNKKIWVCMGNSPYIAIVGDSPMEAYKGWKGQKNAYRAIRNRFNSLRKESIYQG